MKAYDAIEIGKRIAKLRREMGLSQEKLSEKIGISEKHLSKLERGLFRPSSETFFLIGQVFSVSTDYLFTGELDKPLNECVLNLLENGNYQQQDAVWHFFRLLEQKDKDENKEV